MTLPNSPLDLHILFPRSHALAIGICFRAGHCAKMSAKLLKVGFAILFENVDNVDIR